tara:strand:- start:163 stop:438 length:276 start_codon:yes stop_codon:yes gene_type:complete
MAKKKKVSLLDDKQTKELQNMINGMLDLASNVMEEYDDLDLDELKALSGSITQIHETSPWLDEIFEGDSWKRVIKNIPTAPKNPREDNDTE